MNVYDNIVLNIWYYLDKLNNNKEFIKNCPNITPQEYLIAKTTPDIKPKRIIKILNGKSKRIRINELIIISRALNVKLKDLIVENEVKDNDL